MHLRSRTVDFVEEECDQALAMAKQRSRFDAGLAFGVHVRVIDEVSRHKVDRAFNTLEVTTDYPRSYPVHDQRFTASRTDVLIYETEPLEEDLTVAGPLKATLHVSTTGTDADWVVKLVDIYAGDFPDPNPNPAHIRMGGYQQLVRGDVFRGKFRNSFEKPEPFEPGKVTKIEFIMPDVFHTFRRGHRAMVQVQSSWFPLVDRNPQTFVNIHTATPEDFRKATHRVYRASSAASSLTVQVLPSGGNNGK